MKVKSKNGWNAPVRIPASWTKDDCVITGSAVISDTCWLVGKSGLIGYSVKGDEGVTFEGVNVGVADDFWCACAHKEMLYVGGTTGLYMFDSTTKSIRKLTGGVDIKDIAIKKEGDDIGIYFTGYSGGLYKYENGQSKALISAEKAQAVRSIATTFDEKSKVYIGQKNGTVWICDPVNNTHTSNFKLGVPGNGILVTNGKDLLAAHREIKINGEYLDIIWNGVPHNAIPVNPANAGGKSANITCYREEGDTINLYGEDSLEITVDLQKVEARIDRIYEKGLFFTVCKIGDTKIAGGARIKDAQNVISPVVIRNPKDVEPPDTGGGETDGGRIDKTIRLLNEAIDILKTL